MEGVLIRRRRGAGEGGGEGKEKEEKARKGKSSRPRELRTSKETAIICENTSLYTKL